MPFFNLFSFYWQCAWGFGYGRCRCWYFIGCIGAFWFELPLERGTFHLSSQKDSVLFHGSSSWMLIWKHYTPFFPLPYSIWIYWFELYSSFLFNFLILSSNSWTGGPFRSKTLLEDMSCVVTDLQRVDDGTVCSHLNSNKLWQIRWGHC